MLSVEKGQAAGGDHQEKVGHVAGTLKKKSCQETEVPAEGFEGQWS